MSESNVVSIQNAAHYVWGTHCDGWHLVKNAQLSVIEERMGAGSSEQLHFHSVAQQVFYILSGTAVFELDHQEIALQPGESLQVPPLVKHRISNPGDQDLRFLVISAPPSHGDRVNIGSPGTEAAEPE